MTASIDAKKPRVLHATWGILLIELCTRFSCLALMRFVIVLVGLQTFLIAQQTGRFQYFYDDLDQLAKVVDFTGVVIDYIYDRAGNITAVQRSTLSSPTALAVFNFTPQQAGAGTTVTIQGQGFSTTPSQDVVKFNGVAATVTAATANTLTVVIPAGATTGAISVTVGGSTASSTTSYTVLPLATILSVTPSYTLPGMSVSNVTVTGSNLSGATIGVFPPSGITVSSVVINGAGTSATMTVTAVANSVGNYAVVATNASGSTSPFPTSANTFRVLNPAGDEDLDGLTNAQEVAIGTNPFNPDTDGDGYIDGVEVEVGSNPLDPNSTPLTVMPVRQVVSTTLALLNTADPSTGSNPDPTVAVTETVGDILAILNTADPSTGGTDPATTISEALSAVIAIQNGSTGTMSSNTTHAAPTKPRLPVRQPDTKLPRSPLIEGQTVRIQANGEISVEGIPFGGSELLFTAPAGVNQITFRADGREATLPVVRDAGTTVRGKTEPHAKVSLDIQGLVAEFFRFDQPLAVLPDLTGRKPDSVRLISALNIRNPLQVFGNDPFGAGTSKDWAARFRGWIEVAQGGDYEFTLGVREGARLSVGGSVLLDMPSAGAFEERSARVALKPGLVPIEVLHYQVLGNAELQLSWTPPGGVRQVVAPESFRVRDPRWSAEADDDGAFTISSIPAAIDAFVVKAESARGRGESGVLRPEMGGVVDAGTIVLRKGDAR